MNKFNIGDKVQTNIEYMHGFDDKVVPSQNMKRLKNLVIKEVIYIDICEENTSKYSKPYLYTCISDGGTEYNLNECFLEECK